ncbi:MAG: hypothetical protein ACYCYK_11045 [Candidatus Dormibacteria bacterium]
MPRPTVSGISSSDRVHRRTWRASLLADAELLVVEWVGSGYVPDRDIID